MNECIFCLENDLSVISNNLCNCKFNFHNKCYFKWLTKNPSKFRCLLCKKKINKPHRLTLNSFKSLNNYLEIRKNFFKTIKENK